MPAKPSATPWPLIAASIAMLAWLNTGPREVRPVHAGRFEPLRPVAPVVMVQQHVVAKGGRLAQRMPAT